jgi:hypothetical protein
VRRVQDARCAYFLAPSPKRALSAPPPSPRSRGAFFGSGRCAPPFLFAYACGVVFRDPRQPRKPKPAKPASIIAQVDGSGTGAEEATKAMFS